MSAAAKMALLIALLSAEPPPRAVGRPDCWEVPTFSIDFTQPGTQIERVWGERECEPEKRPLLKGGFRHVRHTPSPRRSR